VVLVYAFYYVVHITSTIVVENDDYSHGKKTRKSSNNRSMATVHYNSGCAGPARTSPNCAAFEPCNNVFFFLPWQSASHNPSISFFPPAPSTMNHDKNNDQAKSSHGITTNQASVMVEPYDEGDLRIARQELAPSVTSLAERPETLEYANQHMREHPDEAFVPPIQTKITVKTIMDPFLKDKETNNQVKCSHGTTNKANVRMEEPLEEAPHVVRQDFSRPRREWKADFEEEGTTAWQDFSRRQREWKSAWEKDRLAFQQALARGLQELKSNLEEAMKTMRRDFSRRQQNAKSDLDHKLDMLQKDYVKRRRELLESLLQVEASNKTTMAACFKDLQAGMEVHPEAVEWEGSHGTNQLVMEATTAVPSGGLITMEHYNKQNTEKAKSSNGTKSDAPQEKFSVVENDAKLLQRYTLKWLHPLHPQKREGVKETVSDHLEPVEGPLRKKMKTMA